MDLLAPAKVNLFLHVGGPTADGFHPICSLMAFADIGDKLDLEPGGEGLRIVGPFAHGLQTDDSNLVVRARDALLAAAGATANFGLKLYKALPVASGLGGGSSDAAATLRLVRDYLGLSIDDDGLRAIAAGLGSDTPACIGASPVIATGRGERLATPPPMPDLAMVLVNPGVPSPTGPVYRAYDAGVLPEGASSPVWPDAFASSRDVVTFLKACRNDLQAPAVALAPAIGAALDRISAEPSALLTRMSGSGATCFAICADSHAAIDLASRLRKAEPTWWTQACRLAGSA